MQSWMIEKAFASMVATGATIYDSFSDILGHFLPMTTPRQKNWVESILIYIILFLLVGVDIGTSILMIFLYIPLMVHAVTSIGRALVERQKPLKTKDWKPEPEAEDKL